MFLTVARVLVLGCLAVASLAAQAPPITVYVFTRDTTAGFTDVNVQQRSRSVADLKRWLAKKKGLAIVEDRAAADLQIEVLEHARKETGATNTNFGLIGPRVTKETIPAVHVALRADDYTLEIEGRDRRWDGAADAVSTHVAQWVRENRAILERRRASPVVTAPQGGR